MLKYFSFITRIITTFFFFPSVFTVFLLCSWFLCSFVSNVRLGNIFLFLAPIFLTTYRTVKTLIIRLSAMTFRNLMMFFLMGTLILAMSFFGCEAFNLPFTLMMSITENLLGNQNAFSFYNRR